MNAAADVNWLNEMEPGACADADRLCCGSDAWVRSMVAARPFVNRNDLLQKSDHIWRSLQRADWLQAFAAHPQIGSRAAEGWAAGEQAGTRDAASVVLNRLSIRNREYESRFGYIFIVCATGRSADDMLVDLSTRLEQSTAEELRTAAEEQAKITRLRLHKLIGELG